METDQKKQWPNIHDPLVCGIDGYSFCIHCQASYDKERQQEREELERNIQQLRFKQSIGMSLEDLLAHLAPGIAEIADAIFDHRKGA